MKIADDYVAVYDISDDRERRKVEKILKGFGFRVQKSVFECRLEPKIKQKLIRKLNTLNIQTGFVKIYRLETLIGSEIIGHKSDYGPDAGNAFIV